MKQILIDGRSLLSREQLHTRLQEELQLPDWYGGNLDALADCLGDLSEPVTLTITHTSDLVERFGRWALALQKLLRRAQRETPCLTVCLYPEDGVVSTQDTPTQ